MERIENKKSLEKCDEKSLEKYDKISLEELEQTIIILWNDVNSTHKTKLNLTRCLFERKYRINNDHPITEREIIELKRVNKLITDHTLRVCAEVEELLKKLKTDVLVNYNELTVKAVLYPSGDLIKYDSDELSNYEVMSEILFDEFCPISDSLLEISLCYNRTTGEEHTHYMCFYNEDTRVWENLFDFTFRGTIDKKEAFEVYYPMHYLYDHSSYSLQDIIRISDFKSEITVTFE